jgi:hypothetical protein
MTRAQAERELRRRIETELPESAVADRLTVGDAGARPLAPSRGSGAKRSTLQLAQLKVALPWAARQATLTDRHADSAREASAADRYAAARERTASAVSTRRARG